MLRFFWKNSEHSQKATKRAGSAACSIECEDGNGTFADAQARPAFERVCQGLAQEQKERSHIVRWGWLRLALIEVTFCGQPGSDPRGGVGPQLTH